MPTTLFPHKEFRTYCIREWVRISAGVNITVKRNISLILPGIKTQPVILQMEISYCFISN